MTEGIAHHAEHRDDEGSKLGIWLFIFTELLFFGGLFITYAVYRHGNSEAFHLAGKELDVTLGTINTVILLISSMTIAMATTAIQKKEKRATLILIGITLLLALAFLVNKYFEWSAKIDHGIYPGSEHLKELQPGEMVFFNIYYLTTGLHGIHVVIGGLVLAWAMLLIKSDRVNADDWVILENAALYWHLVDLIWIFIFPLYYLILH
jgi:cytochrome c oxidase subunit 3